MRLLHVVYSCVPGKYPGGVPRVVYELSCAQARLGHEVTIFTTNTNGKMLIPELAGTTNSNSDVNIRYFPVGNHRWYVSALMKRSLLDDASAYDVVHGHNTFLALNNYVRQWSRASGKPTFFHVHGALDPKVINRGSTRGLHKRIYLKLFELRNYRAASGLFALTDMERDQLRNYRLPVPLHVMPNGVNLPAVESQLPENDDKRFLYVGRIVPKKGLHVLIKAFSHVVDRYPDATLIIAGDRASDPVYTTVLDRLIADCNLVHSVQWLGFLSEDELAAQYNSASVFCHVTESEGMAMSVLEAMAAGLPVVVSKHCYMDDALEDGALRVSEYDVEHIASELATLVADADLRRRLGSAARSYVAKHHSWSKIAEAISKVYEESL